LFLTVLFIVAQIDFYVNQGTPEKKKGTPQKSACVFCHNAMLSLAVPVFEADSASPCLRHRRRAAGSGSSGSRQKSRMLQ